LFDAASWAVQSSVPRAHFELFVDSLKTQNKISVTTGNAVSLSLLANEFVLSDLVTECATFSVPVDQFLSLSRRVSTLERQISSFSSSPRQIEERIAWQEEGLEHLRLALEQLHASPEESGRSVPKPLLSRVGIPMKQAKSLEGIIAISRRNTEMFRKTELSPSLRSRPLIIHSWR
jgi:hypothetical protein